MSPSVTASIKALIFLRSMVSCAANEKIGDRSTSRRMQLMIRMGLIRSALGTVPFFTAAGVRGPAKHQRTRNSRDVLVKHSAPGRRHGNNILYTNAADIFQIGAGFDRNHHSAHQSRVFGGPHARRLVDFQAQPVACGMWKGLFQLEFPKNAAGFAVNCSRLNAPP